MYPRNSCLQRETNHRSKNFSAQVHAGDYPVRTTPSSSQAMILRAGLAVVDHISQSMHYEDMLSWLLFYTSLLDLRKMPQVDITDPGGIVRSQVVEAANGALRIALNASQIQRTQSSRFLDEYFGSGVQHIALASNALVDTVAKLKANSVAILPFRKLLRRSRRSSRFIPRITRCLEGQQHVI